MTPKVLAVDDEPTLIAAYRQFLGHRYHVESAIDGQSALVVLAEKGPFSVVVSDLQMPGMDGIQLLTRVRAEFPDPVRVLVTGAADVRKATEAVNDGGVFRFLTKPCSRGDFIAAVDAAAAQHRLVAAERELLDKTLRGSVQLLAEVFALTDPDEFGQAVRVQQLARDLAAEAGVTVGWEVDVAAVLCRLGSIVIPDDVLRAARRGTRLTEEEQQRVEGIPKASGSLLRHIPRLDAVIEIINHIGTPFDAQTAAVALPLGARILTVAFAYDTFVSRGLPPPQAVERLESHAGSYDPTLLGRIGPAGSEAEYARQPAGGRRQLVPGDGSGGRLVQ